MNYNPLRPFPDNPEAQAPDTIEFDAVEVNSDQRRIDLELTLKGGTWEAGDFLDIQPDFRHPVEFRFGRTSETSPCLLAHGSECPQLRADYILFQPDVVAQDPRKGWLPIGGIHTRWPPAEERIDVVHIGRLETPQLRLGPDVSRSHAELHLRLQPEHEHLELHAYADLNRYVRVSVDADDLGERSRGLIDLAI
jgi:hypothetical protein